MSAVQSTLESATVATPEPGPVAVLHEIRDGLQRAETELDHVCEIIAGRDQGETMPASIGTAAERIVGAVSVDLETLRGHVERLSRFLGTAVAESVQTTGDKQNLDAVLSRMQDRLTAAHRLLWREVEDPREEEDLLNDLIAPTATVLADLLSDWSNTSEEIRELSARVDCRDARQAVTRMTGDDAVALTRMLERLELRPGLRGAAAQLVETWLDIEDPDGRHRALTAVRTIAKSIAGVKA